ncbi:MAG: glycosyltransferase [Kiritimatiellae bacterium]|nr:glycosyltransferase [Kiritimatiellia bacterium]
MTVRIDQILAGYADGDAISHEATELCRHFRAWGVESNLYVDPARVSESLRNACRPLDAYVDDPEAILLHHYSVGSPALESFESARARKVLIYHNITPGDYYRGYDEELKIRLDHARAHLPTVAGKVDALWADSEFNAGELKALGLDQVVVFPLLFPEAALKHPDDPWVARRFAAKLTTFLYVGRVAPNKRIEDLIEAFNYYNKRLNPYSRLVIVGSERSCPKYYSMLSMLVADLDLPNVGFEGFGSPGGLPTYYRHADVFLMASDHEGYCLPLVEAMYFGVPVLARSRGGIPEAMGGGGLRYEALDGPELAVLMDRVVRDPALRSQMIASQKTRIEQVLNRDVDHELRTLMKPLLPS